MRLGVQGYHKKVHAERVGAEHRVKNPQGTIGTNSYSNRTEWDCQHKGADCRFDVVDARIGPKTRIADSRRLLAATFFEPSIAA